MPVFATIGAAVFGAGTFLAGLTAAALQVVTGVAVSLVAKALQGEPQKPRFQVQGQIQAGDDVPRSILFGWNCTAGSKVYQNEWGISAPQEFSTRVIALSDYPVRELRGMEVDGKPVTILWGEPHADRGYPIAEYRKSFFGFPLDHLWVKFYDGTQTSADPFLVNAVSSAERPYSSSRVGRGVAYAIVTSLAPSRNDGEEKPLFQSFPQYKFITYGARLYDPSRDSTVGGVGAQRWDDPSTWGGDGDFLVPVQIYNLLRGIRWNGQWLYGLQNMHAARLPVSHWIEQIGKARATIAGPDGLEPTFRAGGEIQVGAPIHIAIEGMLTAGNGRLAESGATYKLHLGATGSPVMSFTDGDILSTEEQTFTPFYSLSDTVNGIAASYPNPAEGWNVKTAPALLRPDLEELDGGRRLTASLSMDLVPYPGQVQRLMKWALSEALRARRHTFVLGPEFRALEPGDVVLWTSSRNGYIDKLFRVDGLAYKANLDVIVDLTEVDPSDYDWDQGTDYRPVVDGPLTLVGPKPVPLTGWQVLPAILNDDQGRPRRPSIEVRYASGVPGVERVRVQVRVAGGDAVFDGELPYGDPWAVVLSGQFSPATEYEVRGVFVGPDLAEWSTWLPVTTPDVKLLAGVDFDPYEGVTGFDQLAEDLEGYQNWIGQNLRELIEQAEAQATLTGDQELANSLQFDELRRGVSVQLGEIEAAFEEVITVAIIPLQGEVTAISDQLTTLTATVGGLEGDIEAVESSVTVRGTAQASPGGGWARWGVEVRTGSGDNWSTAGFFVDTNGSLSRVAAIADQFIITDSISSAGENPFVFESGTLRVRNAVIQNLTNDNIQNNSLTSQVINVADLFAQNANITGTLRVGPGTSGPGVFIQGGSNRILIVDNT